MFLLYSLGPSYTGSVHIDLSGFVVPELITERNLSQMKFAQRAEVSKRHHVTCVRACVCACVCNFACVLVCEYTRMCPCVRCACVLACAGANDCCYSYRTNHPLKGVKGVDTLSRETQKGFLRLNH